MRKNFRKKNEIANSSLKVHDGMSEDDPLIGRYCGTQVPAPITSTSNVLYVRFVADYTVHKAGFNATYQQQDGEDLSITFCILKVQGQVSVIFIKKNVKTQIVI